MARNNNFTDKIVVVGTSATEILPKKNSRTAVILYNQSNEDVKLWLNSASAYIVMQANSGLEFLEVGLNHLYGSVDSGTATITVWEA